MQSKKILIDASQNNPGTYRYFVELFRDQHSIDKALHDEEQKILDMLSLDGDTLKKELEKKKADDRAAFEKEKQDRLDAIKKAKDRRARQVCISDMASRSNAPSDDELP